MEGRCIDEEPVDSMEENLPLIKVTPKHDPDAEITGLTLTVRDFYGKH